MSSSETSHDNNPNKTNERPERKTYTSRRPPQQRRQPKPVYVVEDLREKLNRKKQERDEAQSKGTGPPPDPSYNFLRDPSREDENRQPEAKTQGKKSDRHDYNPQFKPRQEGYGHERPYRGRGRPPFLKNQQRPHPQTIQPVNIKIQLATNTGTRSCTFDEGTILPEIKHVPDRYDGSQRSYNLRNFYNKNSPRGRGGRGRPRGRHTYNHPRGGHRKNDPNFTRVDNRQLEENWDEPEISSESLNQKTSGDVTANEQASENWDQPETSNKSSKEKTIGEISTNEDASENCHQPETSNESSKEKTISEIPSTVNDMEKFDDFETRKELSNQEISDENARESLNPIESSKELSDQKTSDEIAHNKNYFELELPTSKNDSKEQPKKEINNENENNVAEPSEEHIQTYVFEQTKEKSKKSEALEEMKDVSEEKK